MANLSAHKANPFVKTLLLGESKTGKTGSLASLVRAGYSLFVIDFDNGMDYLADELGDTPELLNKVVFETFRDKTKLTSTRDVIIDGRAKAFDSALKALDNGIDGSGPAKDLGEDWVVVVDSLWSAGRSAFYEHQKLQPSNDPRQNFFGAQKMIMGLLENLTDAEFKAHVIVITHMTLIELEAGVTKGLPAAIGKAIAADIPKLFNRMLVTDIKGAGARSRRVIATVPTSLSNATAGLVTGKIDAELPLETGLATVFHAITGRHELPLPPKTPNDSKRVTL